MRFMPSPTFPRVLSAVTLALWMNITAHNEATHCLLIRPSAVKQTIAGPNRVLVSIMNDRACSWADGLVASHQ